MLRRYRGKRHPIQFLTYDLEWVPHTYELRLIGVFDGQRYRRYTTVEEFLGRELSSANRGKIFFAHAGGLTDIQFIFDAFIRRRNPHYRLKAIFSGSSAIIVRISQGKNSWSFCDSYWLLRDRLAKIGASIGLEKGGTEYRCPSFPFCGHEETDGKPTCIFYSPDAILSDYNALDCRILWTAIARLQDELLALGGMMRPTIASSALMLFRSAFLKEDLPTASRLNTLARDSYIASRVEVIKRHCKAASYYDINSSFPASMTKPQPGKLLGSSKFWYEGGDPCLIDALITVPEMHIPPLPMRVKERVYFPIGSFRRWFTSSDLELLLDSGGRIDRIYEVLHFEPFHALSAYVQTVYELRKRETDSFLRLLYKYLMNSLYGKFGEGSEKIGVLINPKKRPTGPGVEMQLPGVYTVKKSVTVTHSHVPIAANITALSRGLITRELQTAEDVYYCDTDSIVTTSTLPTGEDLGQMKLEKQIEKGTFLAPKLYRLYPGPEIRAKGFRCISSDEFDTLEAGGAISINRMIRVRENLRKQCSRPHEEAGTKRTLAHFSIEELLSLSLSPRYHLRPKRAIESNGDTRPWTVVELTTK